MVLFAAAMVYTVALAAVLVASQHDQRRPVDAIIVLGAAQYNGRPSPVLRARLDHAIELYREGYAPLIVVTGGVGRGDTTSEAIVGRAVPRGARDVPGDAVVAQPVGRNTTDLDDRRGRTGSASRGLRRVLLVSDPFHMFRLRLEARRTALEAYTSPTESSPISDNPVLELRYLFAEGLKIPVAWAGRMLGKVRSMTLLSPPASTPAASSISTSTPCGSPTTRSASWRCCAIPAPRRWCRFSIRRATADPRVLLIRQFRHAADGFIWEVPAGRLDAGESPEPCAAARAGGGDRHARRPAGAPHHDLHHARASPTSGSTSSWRWTSSPGRSAARRTSSWSCTRCAGPR